MNSYVHTISLSPELVTPVIGWIDCELGEAYRLEFQRSCELDVLLELRGIFTQETSVNVMVKRFYNLLPELQQNYYLMGYRIRQWISLNCSVRVSDPLGRVEPQVQSICSTMTNLDVLRKQFFETANYTVNYHDIRLEIELN